MPAPTYSLPARCVAEVLGTFILVFFGCGAVHAAVLTGAQSGLWQVAIVWGVAIMVAVYAFGGVSGAHINPAITIALALCGRFSLREVPQYVASQLVGAMLAGAVLLGLFNPYLLQRENERHVTRGGPGSEITAMCYGEYFPSPGGISTNALLRDGDSVVRELKLSHELVSTPVAMLAEFVGTLLLGLAVFAMTDPRNQGAPPSGTAPVFIGLTVAILISVIAPLTQACFNPARDVGPRIVAFLGGWGAIAIPGPRGFLAVYVLAPIAGAAAGGGLYEMLVARLFVPQQHDKQPKA